MKNIRWIILAAVLLSGLAPSCRSYMHFRYGMAQPRPETPVTLAAFLSKQGFPSGVQYMFRDSAAWLGAFRDTVFRKYLLSNMIFNRKGRLLQRDTARCQWEGYEKIRTLKPDSGYILSPDLELDRVMSLIRPLDGDAAPDSVARDPDFTVVVTWAKFIGKYNSRLFALDEAAGLNRTAVIRMIWLNIDIQADWKIPESMKISIQ